MFALSFFINSKPKIVLTGVNIKQRPPKNIDYYIELENYNVARHFYERSLKARPR